MTNWEKEINRIGFISSGFGFGHEYVREEVIVNLDLPECIWLIIKDFEERCLPPTITSLEIVRSMFELSPDDRLAFLKSLPEYKP